MHLQVVDLRFGGPQLGLSIQYQSNHIHPTGRKQCCKSATGRRYEASDKQLRSQQYRRLLFRSVGFTVSLHLAKMGPGSDPPSQEMEEPAHTNHRSLLCSPKFPLGSQRETGCCCSIVRSCWCFSLAVILVAPLTYRKATDFSVGCRQLGRSIHINHILRTFSRESELSRTTSGKLESH